MEVMWKDVDNELSHMFDAIDDKVSKSLERIKIMLNQHNLPIDENIKEYFFCFSKSRLETIYKRFECKIKHSNQVNIDLISNVIQKHVTLVFDIKIDLDIIDINDSDDEQIPASHKSNENNMGSNSSNGNCESLLINSINEVASMESTVRAIDAVSSEQNDRTIELQNETNVRQEMPSNNDLAAKITTKDPVNRGHDMDSSSHLKPTQNSTNTCRNSISTMSKVFKCDVANCKYVGKKKELLARQMSTHLKPRERKFNCEHCPKRFKLKSDLEKHTRIHTGEKPYHCKHCPKKFNIVSNLHKHERIHTGTRSYRCKQCSKKFNQLNYLKKPGHYMK